MNFENKKDKTNLSLKLMDKLSKNDFNHYWTGFNQAPLALYDKEEIYLVNHPNPPKSFEHKGDGIYIGKWTPDYVGNTAIKVNDTFTGIWNLDTLDDLINIDKLYSLIVHEMFHAYQEVHQSNRFVNQLMFINYPFTTKFIELRLNERQLLLDIMFETDLNRKKDLVMNFINIRDVRETMIGDKILFEYGSESIEGTATYVELQSLLKESNLPKAYLVSIFGKLLIETTSLKSFRSSCYYSGLFLALILDEFFDDWQSKYNDSALHLYQFFRDSFKALNSTCSLNYPPKDNIKYAEFLLSQYIDTKKQVLSNFNNSKGYKIILKGEFDLTGFDPMNIIDLNNKILHKEFISCNNNIFIFNQVLSFHGDDLWKVKELHFYCNEKPSVNNKTICIANVGDFSGTITVSDKTYTIELN